LGLGGGFWWVGLAFIGISMMNKIEDNVIKTNILNLIPTTKPKTHILKNNSFMLDFFIIELVTIYTKKVW